MGGSCHRQRCVCVFVIVYICICVCVCDCIYCICQGRKKRFKEKFWREKLSPAEVYPPKLLHINHLTAGRKPCIIEMKIKPEEKVKEFFVRLIV